MGRQSKNRFDASSARTVYKKRFDDRPGARIQESISKRPSIGMSMLTYFINRGGHGLSASRRAELERAKSLRSKRIHRKRTPHRKRASAAR
jgi:hypothetical protein